MKTAETQENRTEMVGSAVTPAEKRMVMIAASALDVTVSMLLRQMSVDEAVRRGERISQKLAELDPAA